MKSKIHLEVPNEGNNLSLGDIIYLEEGSGKAGQLEFNQIIVRSASQTKTEMNSERTKESLVISE